MFISSLFIDIAKCTFYDPIASTNITLSNHQRVLIFLLAVLIIKMRGLFF